MNKELVIHQAKNSVSLALLEDGKLMELHEQKLDDQFQVGDIYLGTVKRMSPGLNAAFVNIGHPKDAFLHYTDLSPKLKSVAAYTKMAMQGQQKAPGLEGFRILPDIDKKGKIDQVLKKKQHILVQVLKEPISTKGPRLTCEITIPGHNLVLLPFTEIITVSKKVTESEERNRLKKLIESIRPSNFGVIIRTAAKGKKVAELHEELLGLQEKWEQLKRNIKSADVPSRVLTEIDRTNSFLRDAVSGSFNKIIVNDKDLYQNLDAYVKKISGGNSKNVSHYTGKKHIFEQHDVKRQIKAAFTKTPTMGSGAYLVIEATEAMHVIDVNSGPKTKRSDQEEAAITVNLEAAEEIARQLRLRDLGGLIIIDFIDMRNRDNKQKLYTSMKKFMEGDRAQHTILQLSRFGLMQITRQRVKPEIQINTAELCSACNGTGKVAPSILIADEIEKNLEHLIENTSLNKFRLVVHPYVKAYLTKGIWNKPRQWYFKLGKRVKVQENADFPFNNFKFYDDMDDEIHV